MSIQFRIKGIQKKDKRKKKGHKRTKGQKDKRIKEQNAKKGLMDKRLKGQMADNE